MVAEIGTTIRDLPIVKLGGPMLFRSIATGLITLVVSSALLYAGCGGSDSSPTSPPVTTPPAPPPAPTPPPPTVYSIEVSPKTVTLTVGRTQGFVATAKASDGTGISGVNFIWSSNNTAIATINSAGVATAVSPGVATIRATGNGITSEPASITVMVPPVSSVTVTPSSNQEMMVGEMVTFTATAQTAGGAVRGDVSISWSSSDTSVVAITSAGVATAVGAGMATIRATVDGVMSSPVAINVSEPPPPEPMVATVTVSPAEATIEEGQTQQFEAMAATTDGTAITDAEFAWSSSDEMVATVDANGLATGVGSGEVMITATADSVSGMATLTVNEPPPPEPMVATVTVSPSQAAIEEGQTQQFEAMAATTDGTAITDAEFAWSSSDEMVATVDANGLATGIGSGEVMITATADGVSGMATLTVSEPPPPPPVVASVTVSPYEATIEEGETQQFSATAYKSDNTEIPGKTFTWKSSDTSTARISSSGLAIGRDAGTTMITATVDGVSGSATLKVTEPPPPPPPPPPEVAIVTVSPAQATIEEGKTQRFRATAYESDNTEIPGKSFTWKSSDTSTARISSTGLATGRDAGTTTITATVDGVSGSATLNVTEPPPPPPPPPEVATVTVSPAQATIEEGKTQRFRATAYESDNTEIPGKSFTWKSSDTSTARINSSGLATGRNAGTTTITATVDGVSGSATLTVTEPPPVVASVRVSPSSASIEEGDTQRFRATAYESDNTEISGKSFTWRSSDTSTARISSSGLATGRNAGSTTITATVDGVSGSATLTVTEPPPPPPPPPPVVATVSVSPASATIEEGDTQRFRATAYESDNTEIPDKSFSWKSSDTSTARISSSGLATGRNAGTTTITATVDGISGSATLKVTEPPPVVASVRVSPSSASIEEGDTQRFRATAYESDNTEISGKFFTWRSSDTSTARISSSGLATGRNAGSTTITATVDGVSGSATLTVTEPPPVVNRVTVSPSSATIEEGDTQRFRATAYESDNTEISGKSFTWKSSDTSTARISSSGLATGRNAGTTTITATVDGVSGSATLKVTEPPPVVASVRVSPSSATIEEGDTQRFRATAYESDNTDIPGKSFTWKSSDTSTARINSSGLATGRNAGTTTITATVDGVSGTATLTVTEPPPVVNRVTVSPSSATIEEGDTQRFRATAYESDNTVISGKSFSWKSSDTSTARINSSGLATGREAGTTTITATVDGVSGTATLTVTEPPPPPPMLRSRTGTISGKYSAAGAVVLSEVAGGQLELTITGLNSTAPDTWLALSENANISWATGVTLPSTARSFGKVSDGNFTRTFTPPSGKNIDSYDYVILYCRAFGLLISSNSLSN